MARSPLSGWTPVGGSEYQIQCNINVTIKFIMMLVHREQSKYQSNNVLLKKLLIGKLFYSN